MEKLSVALAGGRAARQQLDMNENMSVSWQKLPVLFPCR